MSSVCSPSYPPINTSPPQADSKGAGVPPHQDPLHPILARPDADDASLGTPPSDDDPSALSSVSPQSPWDIDGLPFPDGYPDSPHHNVDRLTELAVTELPVDYDALMDYWHGTSSIVLCPSPRSSIPTKSRPTEPGSLDFIYREYHPRRLISTDFLGSCHTISLPDEDSSSFHFRKSWFNRSDYPSDVIIWHAEATMLPMELLLDILEYLARDVKSLFACALTCRRLRLLAQPMINKFRRKKIEIDATRYDDLDELVEWLRPAPKLGRSIETFKVNGTSIKSIPVVLSVLPIRLSSLLISVRELEFRDFTVESQPYPSRWSLYGRAFPNLTKLELACIRFPSLKDFVALITSFPALTTLRLVELELGSPVIPKCIYTCFKQRKLMLNDINIQDSSLFLPAFIPWLAQRNAQLHTLYIVKPIIPRDPCPLLIFDFRNDLQSLRFFHVTSLSDEKPSVQPLHKLAELLRPRFLALKSIDIPGVSEHDIPWVIAILSSTGRSLQTMDLKIYPASENIDPFAWTRLDVVLSSWFMDSHKNHNSKLTLELRRYRFKDEDHSIESLFPLTTSLGKDKWGTFNTWG